MIWRYSNTLITAGEGVAIAYPEVPIAGKTYRVVLYQHGVNQPARDAVQAAARYVTLVNSFTRAGLMVVCVDGGTNFSHWGNDAAITALGAAWTYAKTNLPVKTDGVLLFGVSMGATWSLNWARQNKAEVKGIATLIGAMDVNDIYINDRQSLAAGIATAYGGSPSAPVLATHSPVEYANEMQGMPQRHWYSSDDPIALPSRLSAYASGANLTAGVDTVNYGAYTHSLGPAPYGAVPRNDIAEYLVSLG